MVKILIRNDRYVTYRSIFNSLVCIYDSFFPQVQNQEPLTNSANYMSMSQTQSHTIIGLLIPVLNPSKYQQARVHVTSGSMKGNEWKEFKYKDKDP